MASKGDSDQLKFLLSCIRYSNNGKVDFAEVANECEIVTKGAAAKRYERLMKANGITNTAPGNNSTPKGKGKDGEPTTPKSQPRRKAASRVTPKKRKVKVDESESDADDGSGRNAAANGTSSEEDITAGRKGDDTDEIVNSSPVKNKEM